MNNKYNDEVQNKWKNTDAYKEYLEKTKNYSSNKWNSVNEGLNDIFALFALNLKLEQTPESLEVQELVEQLRTYITKNYYNCTKEILSNLGLMYTSDERFRNNIDKYGNGLALFIKAAIDYYCLS